MSAPDLHALIKVEGGQVSTSGAALDSEPITTVLTAYFGKDELVIAGAEITSQPDDADVTVHGDMTLLGVTVTGDARFFLDDDVAQLEFIGTPPDGWTLGESFESLEQTYFNSFALGAPHLALRSEPVADNVTGVTLDAGFTLPAPLAILAWFVAPDAKATLSGPIALQDELPVMTLTVSPTMKASLGGYVDIDLTMQHLSLVQQGSVTPAPLDSDGGGGGGGDALAIEGAGDDAEPPAEDDPPPDPAPGPAAAKPPVVAVVSLLKGNLSFTHDGKAVAVPVVAGFNDRTGLLQLQLVTGEVFDLALGEIAGWIGGTDLSKAAMPTQYSPSLGLTLHDVVFAVGLNTKSLEYVSLTIVSTKPWPVVGKLTISDIVLTFMITPGAKQTLAATISGTLALGEAASLDIHAHYPNFGISGNLTEDTAIDLIPVLAYLGAVTAGVPQKLQIDVLNFNAEPSGSTYSFEIDVIGDWQIVKGLSVEELKASISYQSSALTLQFSGSFLVGGVDLEISAGYDSELGGWLFTGRAAQNNPIRIGDFITQVANDLSSSTAQVLPDFVQTLEIDAISITFDTATKDFDFRCETKLEIEGTKLDLTLHVSLQNKGDDSYTHLYSGLLVIGSLAFELVFEDAKTGETSSSTLLAAIQPGVGIDVQKLVASISADAGNLMPSLTLTLEDALFVYRKVGAAPATYLFGLAIGFDDFNLQSLPLVGPVLKDAGIGGIKDVQALYASAAVTADDVTAINALLNEAKAKPPLPTKKDATGTTQVLSQGFNFAANLDMGDKPIALTAGGATAPPKPPTTAPPPPAGTPATPPSGNASWFNVNKSIGPATLDRIGVRYESGRVWLLVDADFTLSGLALGLQGLALGTKLEDPKAISVNLDGMSVDFSSGPLSIAGGFLHLGDDYLGEARVKAATFGLTAIGGYAPDDKSFFIFVRLNAPLGGPPFFFVTGVAGGFGINRTLIIPPIDELTSFALLPANNSFPTSLGAGNPGGTLAETLKSTAAYIHPLAGMNWAAVGLDFTSFEMVDSSALATVAFGVDFSVALLGVTRVTVPKADPEPIVYLEITLEAQVKPSAGLVAVDGRITPASFLFAKAVRITGGFAFYIWFAGDHEGDFVISIGGYHPRFDKPDHYPVVPRLQISYQTGNLSVVGQSYMALTPAMLMAGMRIDATWDTGALSAWFSAGIDFLLGWRPFHYEADAYVHIGVSLTIDLLFTSVSITIHVGVDLSIWGPEFGGKASIDLDIVSFTIHFGADPRQDAIDWPGFAEAFLPAGKSESAAPAHLMAALDDPGPPIDHGSLWITGSVSDGLARDLAAADKTSFFAWLVDANQFALQASTLIPAKAAAYNTFDLHAPFTAEAGFTPAATGDTPTALYDTTTYPHGMTWATDFGVLPMQLAPAAFQSQMKVELLRPKPGSDHTQVANYVDAIDSIAVTPQLKSSSTALWAGKDPGLNGDRLIDDSLVGMRLSPMAQHPDITFKADLWAMLFDQGAPITWRPVVPAADTTDSYEADPEGGTLTFTLAGNKVTCVDYTLTALTIDTVAQARKDIVTGLASLGLPVDPNAIDVSQLARYPLWDWPAIRTLGEELAA
ncbi:MAG TPA: DUF6603 domain-containing protein [Caulobacteraceae bacterium]|nr:DUF6603 domain-containing protein [Caulobacteraceae bacterium]